MSFNKPIHLYNLLNALSLAMDFNRKGLMHHHQRVTLLSLKIADSLQLPVESKRCLFCGAILHDAGTSTWQEKIQLEEFEVENPWEHCQRGATLIKNIDFLTPITPIIFSHHDHWEGGNPSGLAGEEIPIESRIIHLADRVDILAYNSNNLLNQRDEIVSQIKSCAGKQFDPLIIEVFSKLSEKEHTWLDLNTRFIRQHLDQYITLCTPQISHHELLQVSEMFARIIDDKSTFTHWHSRLVAEIAAFLARKMDFDNESLRDIKVAGLLHDLGKLTIPDEILEKPGKLNPKEFNIMKQHTYYTYQILQLIKGFEKINKWASYHHEKLNGSGYPFHLTKLCLGSRIMAVSDLYSALVEDRPYRSGLSRSKIFHILDKKVNNRDIDGEIVCTLKEYINEAESIAYGIKESTQNVT